MPGIFQRRKTRRQDTAPVEAIKPAVLPARETLETPAQEASPIRRMVPINPRITPEASPETEAEVYEGYGSYEYQVMPNGGIKVVSSPSGGGFIVTKDNDLDAWGHIAKELEKRYNVIVPGFDPSYEAEKERILASRPAAAADDSMFTRTGMMPEDIASIGMIDEGPPVGITFNIGNNYFKKIGPNTFEVQGSPEGVSVHTGKIIHRKNNERLFNRILEEYKKDQRPDPSQQFSSYSQLMPAESEA